MNKYSTEILVVGGGAAGLSAALAASDGSEVMIVDDNHFLGGQIWRAEMGKTKSPDAKRLIDQITAGQVKIVNNTLVFGSESGNCLLAESSAGRRELHFEKLIIATGARERFLPFPGWTLPGVYGAGGLQAMVKSGMSVTHKRVVVAGTGPLLLAVADYLKAKGAIVLAVAEQAPAGMINRFGLGLWRSPAKIVQAGAMLMRLIGVPRLTDCWVTSAHCGSPHEDRASSDLRVTLFRKGSTWKIDCDFLACGFHLIPNTELAALLGCRIEDGFVDVDGYQQTSLDHVYCAGEPTGIGGVEASLIEGRIAGLAASGRTDEARKHFAERDKTRLFGRKLNTAFTLRDELKSLASVDTIVCRCEDVEYGRLTEFTNFRDAKLQTRCGMGSCQGRICGAATEFLFGWKPGSVRPPLFPVKMEDL